MTRRFRQALATVDIGGGPSRAATQDRGTNPKEFACIMTHQTSPSPGVSGKDKCRLVGVGSWMHELSPPAKTALQVVKAGTPA